MSVVGFRYEGISEYLPLELLQTIKLQTFIALDCLINFITLIQQHKLTF